MSSVERPFGFAMADDEDAGGGHGLIDARDAILLGRLHSALIQNSEYGEREISSKKSKTENG